uniref:Putative secreted protein n=1 Tax=Ixodes ricinus TaxID=34613 RepID=A0A6B0UA88_IXORI
MCRPHSLVKKQAWLKLFAVCLYGALFSASSSSRTFCTLGVELARSECSTTGLSVRKSQSCVSVVCTNLVGNFKMLYWLPMVYTI